jgi:hypothetical protein
VKKLKWQKEPPRINGWWFVSHFKRSNSKRKRFVEVSRVRQRYGVWEFASCDTIGWDNVNDFPAYEWAGPLIPPL